MAALLPFKFLGDALDNIFGGHHDSTPAPQPTVVPSVEAAPLGPAIVTPHEPSLHEPVTQDPHPQSVPDAPWAH